MVFPFSINKSETSPLNRFNMLFAARPAGVRGYADCTLIPRRGFVPRSRRLPFWLILVFAASFTVPGRSAADTDGPANRTYLHKNWQIQSSCDVKATGDQISQARFDASGWHKADIPATVVGALRSEERRVGKECRSRWSPYH